MVPQTQESQTPLPTPQPENEHKPESKQPSRRKKLWIIAAIIVGFIIVGIAGYLLGKGQKNDEPQTVMPSTTPFVTQIMPSPNISASDAGIPIKANTVSFTRANDAIYLRYRGKVYSEEAANKNDPSLTNLPNPNQYTWYGLVDAPAVPAELQGFDELFDFKTLPDKKNFVFIMRWPFDNTKTVYPLYGYNMFASGDKVSLYHTVTQGQSGNENTTPRFKQISPDGNNLALNMFSCWNCGGHAPKVFLFSLQSKKIKDIGKVSYFNWKDGSNYEFKEYKVIECNPPLEGPGECSEDPNNLPLQTGSL